MDKIWGINCFGHDASLCVIQNNTVIWHKKASEFSGILNDDKLNQKLVDEALMLGYPKIVCFYENTFLKKTRQLFSGDWRLFENTCIKQHLKSFGVNAPIRTTTHHKSHAAYGYYTSEFKECLILVADAIGEWETLTVWYVNNNRIKKLHSRFYPYSLGLFYSSFTKLVGLQPLKDEDVFCEYAMASNKKLFVTKVESYLKTNLHKGIDDWCLKDENVFDVASSVQHVFEEQLLKAILPYRNKSKNLIFTGGCAYNLLANKTLTKYFNVKQILNPGDSSSSIGSVAVYLKSKIKEK
jgi:carbamoyltransferase